MDILCYLLIIIFVTNLITMKRILFFLPLLVLLSCQQEEHTLSFFQTNLFPYSDEHTHGSTVAELPDGSLLAAWFQGHGERWADDVRIMGARLRPHDTVWSRPFLMADVPDFPDINPALFLDKEQRLWLFWYTVLANQWSTSFLRYRISTDYLDEGPPRWDWQKTLFVKPGDKTERGIRPDDRFVRSVEQQVDAYGEMVLKSRGEDSQLYQMWEAWKKDLLYKARGEDFIRKGYYVTARGERIDTLLGYPRFRRMGWQTKNKAVQLQGGRILLPLYSDGFDFSLMAFTDDGGEHWHFSTPLVAPGAVQPSIAIKKDGTLAAYMRDNGPPPQRLMYSESSDSGRTWTLVRDSQLPNPGSGADIVTLHNGHWVLAYNDTEEGRHSLAVALSTDEGRSWPWVRHLERDDRDPSLATSAAYPSIIEGKNGILHVVYSYSRNDRRGEPNETIRYARITEEWIRGTTKDER